MYLSVFLPIRVYALFIKTEVHSDKRVTRDCHPFLLAVGWVGGYYYHPDQPLRTTNHDDSHPPTH